MSFHIRRSLIFFCFYNKLYNILLDKLRRATFSTSSVCLHILLLQDISICQIRQSNDQNHPQSSCRQQDTRSVLMQRGTQVN